MRKLFTIVLMAFAVMMVNGQGVMRQNSQDDMSGKIYQTMEPLQLAKGQKELLKAEHKASLRSATAESPWKAPITDQILFEGFEGTTGTNIPAGWDRQGTASGTITASTNGAWITTGTTVHAGTRTALINLNGAAQQNAGILFSPDITLEAGITYEVEFWLYWGTGTSTTHLDCIEVDLMKFELEGEEEVSIAKIANIGAFTGQTAMPQQAWTRVFGTFTAPETGSDYYLQLLAYNINWGLNTTSSSYRGGNIRVDDIKVKELTTRPNDIALQSYLFPMTQVPTSQTILPLTPLQVKNIGLNAQTDVQVSATNNGTAIGVSATEPSLAAGATQTFTVTPTAKFALGANAIELTASQAETDDDATDNKLNFTVTGTANVFAADAEVSSRWIIGSTTTITRSGNIFVVTEPVTLSQVQMRFNAVTSMTFNLNLYEVTNPATLTIAATPLLTVTGLNRNVAPSGGFGNFTVPATVLAPGTYYLETEEGANTDNLAILADGVTIGYRRASATATTLTAATGSGGGANCLRMYVISGDNSLTLAGGFPYTKIPKSQVATLAFPKMPAVVSNIGGVPQTNVVLSATMDGTPLGSTDPLATIAVGATVEMTLTPEVGVTLPTTKGSYPVVYTIAQDETDLNPANETVTSAFEITDDLYARDGVSAAITEGGVNAGNSYMAGQVFTITAETTLKSVQLGFAALASGTPSYAVRVYPITGGTELAPTLGTQLFNRTGNRPTAAGWVTVTPPSTTVLSPGKYYVAAVQTSSTGFALAYDRVPGRLDYFGNGSAFATDDSFGAPAIRMILDFPIEVEALEPADEATDVAIDAAVAVTFNKTVAASDLTGITFDPAVTGVSASVAGAVLTITHDDFELGTEYTVTIPAGAITDYNEVIEWSFTTIAPLEVLSVTPADEEEDVELDAEVSVTFNADITSSDVSGIEFDPAVTGVAVSIKDNVLSIAHDEFAGETKYTVTIPAGTIDGYDEVIEWSFTTTKGTSINAMKNNVYGVYPTLTKGAVTIYTSQNASVQICDLTGKVMDRYSSNGELNLNLNYANGVYFVKIDNGRCYKVVLQK